MTRISLTVVCILFALALSCDGFTLQMMAKGRRGSLGKELGGNQSGGVQSMSGGASSSSKRWLPIAGLKSVEDLPKQDGKVSILETNVQPLMDAASNPTGAVGVIQYGPKTYCTSISCASCKIPLTKARILPPNEETSGEPRIACDFCSATYNLATGERVTTVEKGGLMGGIVKGLFSKQDEVPLPVYELGESKGKVVINIG